MSWIRVDSSLPRHPKTVRLAHALGISKLTAMGHLISLWTWAGDYAQDGFLGAFTPEEIADGASWAGDAVQFLDALNSAAFLDPDGQLHDWHEFQGALIEKRDRDRERSRIIRQESRKRSATVARPSRERSDVVAGTNERNERTNDTNVEEKSSGADAPPFSAAGVLFEFNAMLGGVLPKVEKLTPGRKTAILARIKEHGRDGITSLFSKARASAFLTGDNDRNWKPNFDWLMKRANAVKVLEGNYDGANGGRRLGVTKGKVTDMPTTHEKDRAAADVGKCPRCGGPNPDHWDVCRECLHGMGITDEEIEQNAKEASDAK